MEKDDEETEMANQILAWYTKRMLLFKGVAFIWFRYILSGCIKVLSFKGSFTISETKSVHIHVMI